ncbi:protein kinase [Candidatus Woesearchaeota archaeon]|nr:protein kinase [Candidatus Woesearchaeota archaeon]
MVSRIHGVGISDPPTILILDDNPTHRDLIARRISPGGYKPIVAATYHEAVKVLENNGADIAIIDHNLHDDPSGKSGLDVMTEIHQKHAIPVILISGSSSNSSTELSFEAGKKRAHAFIPKIGDYTQTILNELEAAVKKSPRKYFSYADGSIIGQWKIVEGWRHGSYKEVYKAKKLNDDGKFYALKVWRPPEDLRGRRVFKAMIEADWDISKMFISEYRVLSHVRNNHLAAFEELVRVDTRGDPSGPLLYMVEEFIDGPNLGEYLRGRSEGPETEELKNLPPLGEVYSVFAQVATGILQLHKSNRAHRDIISENILLEILSDNNSDFERFRAVITDFGNMRNIYSRGAPVFMGTLQHLSPEQVREEAGATPTDRWSFGVTLYHCVTGVKPFGSSKKEWSELPVSEILNQEQEVVNSILNKEVEMPSVVRQRRIDEGFVTVRRNEEAIPSELDGIIMNCLSRAPKMRPRSDTLKKKMNDLLRDYKKKYQ